MIRVLQVYPQINNAGTERVIFNIYENIDRDKVQFDFLVESSGKLDNKIISMGGKIHYVTSKNDKEYYRLLCAFFKAHSEYRIVHTHTHARMGLVLKAAKKCGVKCRIAHSHNARNDLPIIAWIFKGLTSIPIEKYANVFFACSSNAAKWLFPHVRNCKVVYNGIKVEDYIFSSERRSAKRIELGLNETDFAMIHVGRFARQKNHHFLMRILSEYNKLRSDWKMLLVGVGPLQDEIKDEAKQLNIESHIIFLGARTDVNELLSAADMFVFPSLHEGLGIVVIEAQCSGLPCIVSDAVPDEADIGLNLLYRFNLQNQLFDWTRAIDAHIQDCNVRSQYQDAILSCNYNIKTIAKNMEQFYLEKDDGKY